MDMIIFVRFKNLKQLHASRREGGVLQICLYDRTLSLLQKLAGSQLLFAASQPSPAAPARMLGANPPSSLLAISLAN
jgi:hypothetical protein